MHKLACAELIQRRYSASDLLLTPLHSSSRVASMSPSSASLPVQTSKYQPAVANKPKGPSTSTCEAIVKSWEQTRLLPRLCLVDGPMRFSRARSINENRVSAANIVGRLDLNVDRRDHDPDSE